MYKIMAFIICMLLITTTGFSVVGLNENVDIGYAILDSKPNNHYISKTLDIAVTNRNHDDVSILLNNGSGGFEDRQDYLVGDRPYGIVAGDFNSDNALDLAVTNFDDDDVSILLNNGSGGFEDRHDYPVEYAPVYITAGDFNSDSFLDLAVTSEGYYDVSILLNNGSGGFEDRQDYPVGVLPLGTVAGDFNSDNVLDLAVTNRMDHLLRGSPVGPQIHQNHYSEGY